MDSSDPSTGKLVRDRIPEIIRRKEGRTPSIGFAHGITYDRLLKAKLLEESQEFIDSGSVEELVDILEVVYALAKTAGVGRTELEQLRLRKASRNGAFGRGLVLYGEN